jgi:hypothetical protein
MITKSQLIQTYRAKTTTIKNKEIDQYHQPIIVTKQTHQLINLMINQLQKSHENDRRVKDIKRALF